MGLVDVIRTPSLDDRHLTRNRVHFAIYGLALVASISTWLAAIRAPLRLDETGSYWQISAGFSGIWGRQGILSPAYPYILWLSTKIIGTSEIALRVPSILAMFGAVYLLYLAARELFERDIAMIAVVVFCLDPIVAFTAIDVRPYAFGVLATNAAILALLRLRRSTSMWLAAWCGILAALICWFHFLLGVVLPALVLCFIVLKRREGKAFGKQFGVAFGAFACAFLLAVPGLIETFRTSGTHVCEPASTWLEFFQTLIPGPSFTIVCCIGFVAFLSYAARGQRSASKRPDAWSLMVCASLALIPTLILFAVSKVTAAHVFFYYHRVSAIPGIALCWAFGFRGFRSRNLRLLVCTALTISSAYLHFTAPFSKLHQYSPKYAIEVSEKSAAADNAPVVMCSDFIESNFAVMPSTETVKDSEYFSPLSYYRLSVPVVPLPEFLSGESIRIGSQFLDVAARQRERFLVDCDVHYSAETIGWFIKNASATHSARNLGVYDGFEVLEFVPRVN